MTFITFITMCPFPLLLGGFALLVFLGHLILKDNNTPMPPNLTLGDRMKLFEKKSESVVRVKPYLPFIIRLDGRKFSRVTSSLVKPFDEVFALSMLNTAKDIFAHSGIKSSTVFVQSDEISIVLPALCTYEEYSTTKSAVTHPYDGRQTKLISVLAGYASVRFAYHFETELRKALASETLNDEAIASYNTTINKLFAKDGAHFSFDGRITVFGIDNDYECLNNLFWRSCIEGHRNFVSMVARAYYSDRQLHKVSTKDQVTKLREEKNVDVYTDFKSHCAYGWLIKGDRTMVGTEHGSVMRTYTVAKSFRMKYSQELVDELFATYWTTGATYVSGDVEEHKWLPIHDDAHESKEEKEEKEETVEHKQN